MEISEIRTAAPAEGRAAVELETFALLDRLHIPYAWVAHETADTIADCDVVSEVLGISICKNLFLCNRQETAFYLLMIPDTKVFHTKDLSAQIGSSAPNWAPPASPSPRRSLWSPCSAAPPALPACWAWPMTRSAGSGW